MNFPWTEDATNDLKTLWLEGKSASEVAKRINDKYRKPEMLPVTRNSVIGKVHRLKLQKRATVTQHHPKKPAVQRNRIAAPKRERDMSKSNVKAGTSGKNEHGGLSFKIAQARKDDLPMDEAMEAVLGTTSGDFVNRMDDTLRNKLIHGHPDCFAVYATLTSRVIGQQCCYPHPDADPRGGPMLVCGAPIKTRGRGEYCDHHRELLGGGAAQMITQSNGLPKATHKRQTNNSLAYMR